MRRWTVREPFDIDGLKFRIVPGRKRVRTTGEAGKDLRLEVWTPGGWRPVHMRLGAFLADFFCENEQVLYPPPFRGAMKYLRYLQDAWKYGWEKAEAELQAERAQKELAYVD